MTIKVFLRLVTFAPPDVCNGWSLWLVQTDHVTWILASDWSMSGACLCPPTGNKCWVSQGSNNQELKPETISRYLMEWEIHWGIVDCSLEQQLSVHQHLCVRVPDLLSLRRLLCLGSGLIRSEYIPFVPNAKFSSFYLYCHSLWMLHCSLLWDNR